MSSTTCSFETEFGPCQQRPFRGGFKWCSFHIRMETEGFRPDRHYHRKLVSGLLEPTDHYISEVEMQALMDGRARNDGRRLDHWTR